MFSSRSRAARRDASAVLARRAGRIAFGIALAAGMLALAWLTLFADPRCSALAAALEVHLGARDPATALIAGTWLAAAASYVAVRLGVWLVAPAPRGDALLRASLVVPAIGLGLALPLGFHLVICVIAGGRFDEWAGMSVRAVGIAHLVFAATFAVRAAQLARTRTPAMSIGCIYGASVAASLVPWGPLILPEALTALTGLLVLPVLWGFDWIAARERDALAQLPTARVRRIP